MRRRANKGRHPYFVSFFSTFQFFFVGQSRRVTVSPWPKYRIPCSPPLYTAASSVRPKFAGKRAFFFFSHLFIYWNRVTTVARHGAIILPFSYLASLALSLSALVLFFSFSPSIFTLAFSFTGLTAFFIFFFHPFLFLLRSFSYKRPR